jgi:hypothetical protein
MYPLTGGTLTADEFNIKIRLQLRSQFAGHVPRPALETQFATGLCPYLGPWASWFEMG